MISVSEKEAVDQSISITAVVKPEKNNKVCVSQSLNNFVVKQLSSKDWLSDETINCSQGFLYNRFPLTKGFEDTSLGILKQYSIQKNGFIQIIHDKNHWVTIHADPETDESTVYLYDSLQKAKVSDSIVKQLCEIRKCSQSMLNIVSIPVQQQLNACDCGVFAVAFATDLAYDKDPAVQHYDTHKIRTHLLHSLQSRLITPFPTTNKRTKRGRKTDNSIKLYCICQMPYFKSDPDNDKGLFMICCSVCEEWYHKKCESIHSLIFKDETKAKNWRCRRCK